MRVLTIESHSLATPTQPASTGVWTFYGSSTINAPAEQIWSIIQDFASYEKWNAYTPTIKTPSGTNLIRIDDMITLAYRPEPTGKLMDVPCKILEINNEEMRLCWRGCAFHLPKFLLLPEKIQRVTKLDNGQCLYEVFETQGGMLAYLIRWLLGEQLSAMSRGMAKGLKEYAEGLQDSQRNSVQVP